MAKPKNNSGFAVLEGLLILAIVLIIGFVGYTVYHDRNNLNKLNEQSAAQQVAVPKASNSTALPSTINNSSDLDKASSALNADNPDDNSSDISQLNSQASF